MSKVYDELVEAPEEEITEPLYTCSICGSENYEDECHFHGDQTICDLCLFNENIVICCQCDARLRNADNAGTDDLILCQNCRETYYFACESCSALVENCYEHSDDQTEEHLCLECYNKRMEERRIIHNYNYKPDEYIFFGTDSDRYFGVEVEIDGAGENSENARQVLEVANKDAENIFIKHDGSLTCGFEMVSQPMTLSYHKNEMNWDEVFKKCLSFGYKSHGTSTCGLHIHVNINSLENNKYEQDRVISKILMFFQLHWVSLLKFSRRSPQQLEKWAARYTFAEHGYELLVAAQKGNLGRYAAVNLQCVETGTIEIRIFRGTLKRDTMLAAIELVDEIIEVCRDLTEDELKSFSWTDFCLGIDAKDKPELIQYLKKKRLFVNDAVADEEQGDEE